MSSLLEDDSDSYKSSQKLKIGGKFAAKKEDQGKKVGNVCTAFSIEMAIMSVILGFCAETFRQEIFNWGRSKGYFSRDTPDAAPSKQEHDILKVMQKLGSSSCIYKILGEMCKISLVIQSSCNSFMLLIYLFLQMSLEEYTSRWSILDEIFVI